MADGSDEATRGNGMNNNRPPPLPSIFVAPNPTPGGGVSGSDHGNTFVASASIGTGAAGRNVGSISNVDTFHRAVHKIRCSALAHNFHEVEAAAGRQRCSVIVVVKADGYGHGAIQTAVWLADTVGADCFAVATLEEGIALRKAFTQTASPSVGVHGSNNVGLSVPGAMPVGASSGPGQPVGGADDLNSLSTGTVVRAGNIARPRQIRRTMRQAHIRILVLGPPVGFPRCFDDYYYYNIECMVSGPEVANALLEWVLNVDERKRTQVERAAAEAKERILLDETNGTTKPVNGITAVQQARLARPTLQSMESIGSDGGSIVGGGDTNSQTSGSERSTNGNNSGQQRPSATLGNVTGSDLAREVREILKIQQKSQLHQTQHHHETRQPQQQQQQQPPSRTTSSNATGSTGSETPPTALSSTVTPSTSSHDLSKQAIKGNNQMNGPVQVFGGIEEAAKHSRTVHKAISSEVFHDTGDDEEAENDVLTRPQNAEAGMSLLGNDGNLTKHPKLPTDDNLDHHIRPITIQSNRSPVPPRSRPPTNASRNGSIAAPFRRRLRWHALVDSGMGRLGFKTDPVTKEEQGKRRDSVEIIHELVDLEKKLDSPVEFFGMCTHMADANSTSTYTLSQIQRFKSLLRRVRGAGIFVPTISTDNSAALLTENLTHFDPEELLKQADANSRGYVRTGGAIYGQRPSFPQLQAVSTLMASVRHVAILKKGESVGYDRAYVAPMAVRIATLTIGFADGYPRELGNGVGKVSIRGHLFPVAGNVCMDMLMVELGPAGDKSCPGAEIIVGDTAILWGPDDGEFGEGHVRLQDLAAILKTTQSALTCGLNKERVLRQYS